MIAATDTPSNTWSTFYRSFSAFSCCLSGKSANLSTVFCIFFERARMPLHTYEKVSKHMNHIHRSTAPFLSACCLLFLVAFQGTSAFAQCDDINANNVCDVDETGCIIELACNYNPSAVFSDPASCDFVSCLAFGCTDENACNFDDTANFDDGSCGYPSFPYDCDGECINDSDGDGTCDEFETPGCTDEDACNFSSGATQDDGSCVLTAKVARM